MNIYQKLNDARAEFHSLPLKKTGRNTFAQYDYFELGDFLIPAMRVMDKHKLCAFISFGDVALMRIVDVDKPEDMITIYSPMSEANLKGCHPVQNLGAVQTYLRRYLWTAALEIVEHDALDATTGNKPLERAAALITDKQAADILALVTETGTDTPAFLAWVSTASGTEVKKIADMPASAAAPAIKKLEAKRKAK